MSNFGFVIGTSEYKKLILKFYFEYLIKERVCEIEKSKNLNNFIYQFEDIKNLVVEVFSCSKDIVLKRKFEKYLFPNLIFQQKDLNYTFFLNFND